MLVVLLVLVGCFRLGLVLFVWLLVIIVGIVWWWVVLVVVGICFILGLLVVCFVGWFSLVVLVV